MQNQFYGGQVGGRADYRLGGFELSATAKIALGDVLQTAKLEGATSTNFFNAPAGGPYTGVPVQYLPGSGTFVQSSNLGRFGRDQFAVAPEIDATVSYQVTPNVRAFAGYDFLFISRVLRPGNQINREINFSQTVQSATVGAFAGPNSQPGLAMENSDFWAQGVHLGLEFLY